MPELLTYGREIFPKPHLRKIVTPLLPKLGCVHLRREMGVWPKRFVSFLYRHFTLLNGITQFAGTLISFIIEICVDLVRPKRFFYFLYLVSREHLQVKPDAH